MITIALVCCLLGLPQQRFPVRQPKDFPSANGNFVFHLDPSDPLGIGPAHCRLSHGKEVAWEKELPLTFDQVGVADDGTVVGYTNETGYSIGALRITVIDPRGEVRKQHDIAHEGYIVDGGPIPSASGPVLIQQAAGLALFRFHESGASFPMPWKTLRLATGEFSEDITPSAPETPGMDRHVYGYDARVIGDSGLILCQWWYSDYFHIGLKWPKEGGIFSLVNLKGESVWEIRWLDDYTDSTSELADDQLEERVRQTPPILSTGPGNRFALWNVKPNQRVEFVVEKDPSASAGWKVREAARVPMLELSPAALVAARIELAKLETIAIGDTPEPRKSPIHDVMTLSFKEDGSFEFVRKEPGRRFIYCRLNPSGELVFERDLSALLSSDNALPKLPDPPGDRMLGRLSVPSSGPKFYDLPGDRMLRCTYDASPRWIDFDVTSGATRPCPLPENCTECSIAPLADGGYLALCSTSAQGIPFSSLCSVTKDGAIAWAEQARDSGPEDTELERTVRSARGLVCVNDNEFAVLTTSELVILDSERAVLRTTSLASILGHDPSYLSGLLPDRRWGVYFREGDRCWHVNALGNAVGSFVPRRADGSLDDAFVRRLTVAPDGRLWTTDGNRIFRLDESGGSDLAFGPTRFDGDLDELCDPTIDARGRILVRDFFSGSLHVFDSKGVELFVFAVPPAEHSNKSIYRYLSLPDGTVWIKMLDELVHIGLTGEHLESRGKSGSTSLERLNSLQLSSIDPLEVEFKAIQRRPDGMFLERPAGRAALSDGGFVIAESPNKSLRSPTLQFYSATHAPLASLQLPDDTDCTKLTASARWIVLGSIGPTWTLVRLADKQIYRFEPILPDGSRWEFGQTADGKVLLLLSTYRNELLRYELP